MEFSENDIISEIPSGDPGPSSSISRTNLSLKQYEQNLKSVEETVPPKPAESNAFTGRSTISPTSELNCLTCCCLYGRDETFTHPIVPSQKEQYVAVASKALRQFLSSVAVYCYVLILTFAIVILLLAELLIALDIIVVPDDDHLVPDSSALNSSSVDSVETTITRPRQVITLYIMHWTNFSLLCLCVFEMLLRVFAWKLDIVKSLVSVGDCAAITVSFVVNIVTTLAAGYDSPFNSISLLIVFRFVRIVSLVEACVRRVKVEYSEKLNKAESNAAQLQMANQRLHRQISEKDYEIKQLRAHLGSLDAEACENLTENLNKRKKMQTDYDEQLEKAIALSKMEYEEANGGYDNPNFTRTPPIDSVFVPDIMIHHRQNSIKRKKAEGPSTSGMKPSSSGDTGAKSSREKSDVDISHGDLHSGTDIEGRNVPADTSLLLQKDMAGSDHWTVGFCIIKDPHPVLPSAHSKGKARSPLKGDKLDSLSEPVDEGIGDESASPEKNSYIKSHSRSRSEAACYITEDTLSDQGCLSATSLCSESGYQSDDRYVAAPLHQEEEADQVSAHTVLSISAASSQTSVVAIPMETLDFSEVVENEDVNNDEVAL